MAAQGLSQDYTNCRSEVKNDPSAATKLFPFIFPRFVHNVCFSLVELLVLLQLSSSTWHWRLIQSRSHSCFEGDSGSSSSFLFLKLSLFKYSCPCSCHSKSESKSERGNFKRNKGNWSDLPATCKRLLFSLLLLNE